jgi:hypothetical protein
MPPEASSQPGLQDPSLPDTSGILTFQRGTPPDTLHLLQGPALLTPTAEAQGGVRDSSIDPGALQSLVGGSQATNLPPAADQNYGLRGNNTVIWSDNRGTWKSDPPGDACMLQSKAQINADSCN